MTVANVTATCKLEPRALATAILLLLFVVSAHAANKTCTGGNMSVGASWGGTVPGSGDTLRINGACVVDNAFNNAITYGSLEVSRGATGTVSWPVSPTKILNVTSVVTGSFGAGTIDMTNGGTLNIRTGWTSTNTTLTPGAGTVIWNNTGGGANDLPSSALANTFNNLTILVGTRTASLGQATTVNGNLLISTGTLSVSASNFALNVKGNFTHNGTGFTAGTGTVTLSGTTAQAIDGSTTTTFNNLTIANASATVSLSPSTNAMNVTGDFTHNGAGFNAGTSTVSMSGTAAQAIAGSSTTTFNNLTISNTSAAVTLSPSTNVTNVSGTLNMNGAATMLTPAAAVVLNSAAAAGTITGTGTVQVTRTAATADYSSQYKFTTNTLTNLTVEYAGTSAQTVSALTYGGLKINNASGAALTGATTVGGTLTLTSGVLSVGANTLNLNGPNTAVTSGSLSTTSSSDLSFGGSSAGVNVPTGVGNLNNLTINNTNGVSLGSVSPTLSGTLTLTSGVVSVGANTLTLNGPNTSVASGSLTTTSSSSLSFGGSSTGVNVPTGVTSLNNLTIDNSNGVSLGSSSPSVAGTLTLTNGTVTTGSNTLAIGSAGSISGAGTTKYVIGNLQKAFLAAVGSFTYPLGDGTSYTPLTVSFAAAPSAGNLTAAVTNTDHPDTTAETSGIDSAKSVNRYWTLKNPTLAGSAGLTLNYVSGDNDSGTTPGNYVVRRGATCSGSGVSRTCTGGWSTFTPSPAATNLQAIVSGVSITSGASEADFAVGEATPPNFLRENEFIYSRELY